jgi:cytochrome c553
VETKPLHIRSVVARAAISFSTLVHPADRASAETIAEKAAICAGCHGEDGVPQEKTTPIIWGQREGYLFLQLRDYKRGDRKHEVMTPLAETLERTDMLALAEYFANKPWPDLGQPRAPKDVSDRALRANASVGCTGCHLDQWQGYGTVPRLAGLSRDYLTKTIAEFRTRSRGNNPGMSDLMIVTSEEDLESLVEYLAGR